jgi:hypothetical protein
VQFLADLVGVGAIDGRRAVLDRIVLLALMEKVALAERCHFVPLIAESTQ